MKERQKHACSRLRKENNQRICPNMFASIVKLPKTKYSASMFIKPLTIALGFLLLTLWEKRKPFAEQTENSLWTNLSLGLISVSLSSIAVFTWRHYSHATSNTSVDLITVFKTFILLDLASYFWHLLSHKVPWLWRLHQVHHTEENMTASTAFRFHALEVLFSMIPRFAFIYYFKLPLEAVIIFEILFQLSNMFQHSNTTLPRPLDRAAQFFFVTPTMHRHHHFKDPQKQMTNFSTIFSIWDKMLDTYEPNQDDSKEKLGLPNSPTKPQTLKNLLLSPFKK